MNKYHVLVEEIGINATQVFWLEEESDLIAYDAAVGWLGNATRTITVKRQEGSSYVLVCIFNP